MKSSSHKAPGPSGIPNSILQLLVHQLTSVLLPLFNKCYDSGYCLQAFKNSIAIVLRKPKNTDPEEKPRDYQESKLYRPIALFETVKKALKSIIARKIAYIAKKHNLLPEGYMGRRRCRSTEHVVHTLVEFITIAWNKDK